MDVEAIKSSVACRKEFVEEFQLPITVFEDPYFTQRLMVFDKVYKSEQLWVEFVEALHEFESLEHYRAYRNGLAFSLRSDCEIESCHIDSEDVQAIFYCDEVEIPGKHYTPADDGKVFLRVRFKDDGYQLLETMANSPYEPYWCTWNNFFDTYSKVKCLRRSARFRDEVLDGFRFERIKIPYLFGGEIAEVLSANMLAKMVGNVGKSLIFEPLMTLTELDLKRAFRKLPEALRYTVEFDFIWVWALGENGKYGYMEEHIRPDGKPSLDLNYINVDPGILTQIELHRQGKSISPDDLVFEQCGQLARYLNPIENPFT